MPKGTNLGGGSGPLGGAQAGGGSVSDTDGSTNRRRKNRITKMVEKGTDPVKDPLNRLEMIKNREFFGKAKIRKDK
jgi:hypothetical protein